MSTVGRLALLPVTGVLVLGTLAWFGFERESGGQEQVRGVAVGLLADGGAEVRAVPWGADDPEAGLDYEVVVEGDVATVRYVDHGGEALSTGTSDEAAAWLDEQGEQLFGGGTHEEAVQHRADLQHGGASGFPVWLVPVWFVPVLVSIVAARRSERADRAASG